MKCQTRTLAAHAAGFAVGGVEGRVAMEALDPSPAAQKAKYAFKVLRAWLWGATHWGGWAGLLSGSGSGGGGREGC